MKNHLIIENYINDNKKDFGLAIKKASKLQILDLIEIACVTYGIKRHEFINSIRFYLDFNN